MSTCWLCFHDAHVVQRPLEDWRVSVNRLMVGVVVVVVGVGLVVVLEVVVMVRMIENIMVMSD